MKKPIRVFCVVVPALALCLSLALHSKDVAGEPLKAGNAPAAAADNGPEDEKPTLIMVKPGSPEAKYIEKLRAEDKAAGRPPHVNLKGLSPQNSPATPPVPEYKGSQLQIDPRAKGDLRVFEDKFIAAFLRHDPQPDSRKTHFSWIPFTPALRQIGWYGAITDAQVQADQSVVVTIKIQPWLFASSKGSVISDFVKEKYLVADGNFTLIDSDADDATNHFHGFPLGNP